VAVLQYVDSGSDEEAEDGQSGTGIGGLPVLKRSQLPVCVEDIDMDFSVRSPWMSDVVRATAEAAAAAAAAAATASNAQASAPPVDGEAAAGQGTGQLRAWGSRAQVGSSSAAQAQARASAISSLVSERSSVASSLV
jgi:hypothetical protein